MFAFSGCESFRRDVKTSWNDKFGEPVYRARTFNADAVGGQAAVYEAALAAARSLGFNFVSGGPAQGRFEARTRIVSDSSFSGVQQFVMRVRLSNDLLNGGTLTEVLILDVTQSDNARMATSNERSLRDTPLYEAFFRGVENALSRRAE